MNALLAYLESRNESVSAFALRIERSPSTLTRALSGDRDPSVGLARDVENGTAGAVSAGEFINICIEAGRTRLQSLTVGTDLNPASDQFPQDALPASPAGPSFVPLDGPALLGAAE